MYQSYVVIWTHEQFLTGELGVAGARIGFLLHPCRSVVYCHQPIWVSVCPRAYLWNRSTDRHKICCADSLWLQVGPPLAALRYVMWFSFYG